MGQCHHDHHATTRQLTWILILTSTFMVVEFIGGLWTNSLALISDAGHMLSDSASLWIARLAVLMVTRPADSQKTYGYQRAEVLAAFMNAIILIGLAAVIVKEAFERLSAPQDILTTPMLIIAIGGLVINLIGVKLLHNSKDHNLNARGAYLHIMGDLLGSVAAIASALIIMNTGWLLADVIVSFFIAALIILSGLKLFWDTTHILMQGTPDGVDQEKIKNYLKNLNGVESVSHLHIWTMGSEFNVATVHVTVTTLDNYKDLQEQILNYLKDQCAIHHPTVQIQL